MSDSWDTWVAHALDAIDADPHWDTRAEQAFEEHGSDADADWACGRDENERERWM